VEGEMMGRKKWEFYEFLDGKNFRVGGMKYQAWSAAAAIMTYEAVINNKVVFLRKQSQSGNLIKKKKNG